MRRLPRPFPRKQFLYGIALCPLRVRMRQEYSVLAEGQVLVMLPPVAFKAEADGLLRLVQTNADGSPDFDASPAERHSKHLYVDAWCRRYFVATEVKKQWPPWSNSPK